MTVRRAAPLLGALVVVVVVVVVLVVGVSGSHGAATATAPAGQTVTISTGGGSAPAVTASSSVIQQTPATIAKATSAAGSTAAKVEVGAGADSQAMPSGFVGLSIEYNAVQPYAAAGPLFSQIVSNLAPGQRPFIRIGGDSADHSTVPIAGFSNGGVWGVWGSSWEAAAKEIATGLNAQLIPDLDLEVNDLRVPVAERKAMLAGIGSKYISAFELGNEPNLYSVFPGYAKSNGTKVYERSKTTWTPAAYAAQLKKTAAAMGDSALWGPALGQGTSWWDSVSEYTAAAPRLTQLTYHAYPLNCYVSKSNPAYPSMAHLLASSSSIGMAQEAAPVIAYAKKTGRGVRIDEINTVACAGHDSISNFSSALWAIQAGYALDKAGISGVNVHMFPTAAYRLFSFGTDNKSVTAADEYYGWLLFSRANPPGSRQLSLAQSGNAHVHAYATKDGSTTNIVLVNDSAVHTATVTLTVPGSTLASVEALRSPGLTSKGGVTFAGMSVDSATGRLGGSPVVSQYGSSGTFSIRLPPASADLIPVTH